MTRQRQWSDGRATVRPGAESVDRKVILVPRDTYNATDPFSTLMGNFDSNLTVLDYVSTMQGTIRCFDIY